VIAACRKNRTCSLSGGRRPARQHASPDSTPMHHSNNGGKPFAESEEGIPLIKENTHQSGTYPTQRGLACPRDWCMRGKQGIGWQPRIRDQSCMR